jgi:hypothetical protein
MNGSYERYADLIRLYILPTFGEMQAAKLDAELLERFYARLQRCREMWSGQPRAGHTCRPLSGSTTRKNSLRHTRGAGARRALAAPRSQQGSNG